MRRRRHLKRNRYKKNKYIILSCLVLTCILAVGYGAFQTFISITTSGHVVFDERCVVGNVFNFEQKDEIQEFKVPCSGTYKLETWGAQGGDANDHDGENKTIGGYGGYSVGNIDLKVKDMLYIGVGGKGETAYNSMVDGGYNGGGKARVAADTAYGDEAGSGGGATHIALNNNLGLLKNYSADRDKILIVSAGGGGAYYYSAASQLISNGGHAGGYLGNNPKNVVCVWTNRQYYSYDVSTQVSGGKNNTCNTNYSDTINTISSGFGIGGNLPSGIGWYCGGGSGWYGGGYGYATGAGGGSSYIGNTSLKDKAMYCFDCEESLDLTNLGIFTISTTGDTNYKDALNCPDGFSENPVSKCAKEGDGYAKITLISKK